MSHLKPGDEWDDAEQAAATIREVLCVRHHDGTNIVVAQYDLDKIKWHGPSTEGDMYQVERVDGRIESFRRWITIWTWENPDHE